MALRAWWSQWLRLFVRVGRAWTEQLQGGTSSYRVGCHTIEVFALQTKWWQGLVFPKQNAKLQNIVRLVFFHRFVVSIVLLCTSSPHDRACLLILLLTTLEATWVVQNPAGSCIFEYPRMKQVFQILKKFGVAASYLVYCEMWMWCFWKSGNEFFFLYNSPKSTPFEFDTRWCCFSGWVSVGPKKCLEGVGFLTWNEFCWTNGCTAKVYKVSFWMIHHGGKTWKRTTLVSNSCEIGKFDLGTLRLTRSTKRVKSTTTRRYIDKTGRQRYVGTPQLKKSQHLALTHKFWSIWS